MMVIMVLEWLWPWRKHDSTASARWGANLALTALSDGLALWAAWGIAQALGAWWSPAQGLVSRLNLNGWRAGGITWLALQVVNYVSHLLSHKVHWMWRLHRVHHSDTVMDVTLARRHHPLESLVSLGFALPVLLALGTPGHVMVWVSIAGVAFEMWTHANITLPARLDRCLSLVLVTPDAHRLHHCADPRYTDSNYANALLLLDRIFGTWTSVPASQQRNLDIGLEYFRHPKNQGLLSLLRQPFWNPTAP